MRLDFNVLWVDDQPTAVDAQIKAIKVKMAEEGFNFNPTLCKSLEEVEAQIVGSVFQDEVDLILVDWDLGGGVHGEEVIAKVREVAQFKDVVFYSADPSAATQLKKLAYENNLEGIYCANREGLVGEVLGVFESLVKKVLDLDHTRGIVMGATSDIDHMVYSCLLQIEAKHSAEGKKNLVDQAIKRVEEHVKDIEKKCKKLGCKFRSIEDTDFGASGTPTSVKTILEEHMIFGANDRLRMLRRLLEGEENHAESVETIQSYMDNVVKLRNDLGHMLLTPEGKPQAVVNSEGTQINLDDMRMLRKTILELREEFRALVDKLRA